MKEPLEVAPDNDAGRDLAPDPVGQPGGDDDARKLRQERDQLQDKWLRAVADLENFRKRAQKEAHDQRAQATVEAVRALLPVLDGFERALAHAPADAGGDGVRAGIELLQRQMQDGLRRLGVEAIETQAARFDPHQHEAVEMVETEDAPDHSVVGEVQRGYKLRDRLIRPAMVRVARHPAR